jgi:hypothetical protein
LEDASSFRRAAQEPISTVLSLILSRGGNGLAVPARLQAGKGGSFGLGSLTVSYATGQILCKAHDGEHRCTARSRIMSTSQGQAILRRYI